MIPKITVTINPPPSFPGIIHLAKIPAISPKMIQERIPMVNRPLVTFKHLVLKRVA
ncbi:hypothetical protein UUU_22650 [Klebsiella pneumoniae subsp. pneumoniae DSM 30104 = JCM 1662 = NBRC 14940]|nr:hypothetical protein UUU_22650 [Klebsiella pneumoniae subsp. pneumoniae DSM 30104 = JCM 1662 = NBRC 14940]